MNRPLIVAAIAAYLAGAIFTFGLVWNRYDCTRPGSDEIARFQRTECEGFQRPPGAMLAAVAWPLALSVIFQEGGN